MSLPFAVPTSTRRICPRSKSSITRRVSSLKPNARANMLPKPLGTGTNGMDSLTAAAAEALSVASPPTAIKCEKVGAQVAGSRRHHDLHRVVHGHLSAFSAALARNLLPLPAGLR